MKLTLEKGRPKDSSHCLEKEIRTYDFLDKLNNTSSLRLKTRDIFENFVRAVNHDYTIVRLGNE